MVGASSRHILGAFKESKQFSTAYQRKQERRHAATIRRHASMDPTKMQPLHQREEQDSETTRDTNQQRSQQVSEEPSTVNVDGLDMDDLVIAVMGPTGAGKSTFISVASGHDTQAVGHSLNSQTSRVVTLRFRHQPSGRHVVLVDTPGFDDTYVSDLDILEMISQWLNTSYRGGKRLSGILYLHRITDNRMAGTPLKNLRMFRKLCGKDALDKIFLTTTMWDEVDPMVGKMRLDELKQEFWKAMISQGAQVVCCRSDDSSSMDIIHQILKGAVCERSRGRLQTVQVDARQEEPPPVSETVNVGDLDAEDIVIAVIGPTGSGKTTFIRTASEQGTQGARHTSEFHAPRVLATRFWHQPSGRYVVLMDTPGLDRFVSDLDVLKMISRWLNASYQKGKRLSGVLYLHRIIDNHMAGTPLRNFQVFRKLCEEDALDKIFLTTTMWDKVDPMVGEMRLEELKQKHWKAMISQGAQVVCCRSDDSSSMDVIHRILKGAVCERDGGRSQTVQGNPNFYRPSLNQAVARNTVLLQETKDIVRMELNEKEGAQELYSQLDRLEEKQLAILRTTDRERKTTVEPDVVAEVQTEYSELRTRLDEQLRQVREPELSPLKRILRTIRKFI